MSGKADRAAVRVFISSPSDVRPERLIAERVVARLNLEFSYHFNVEALLWEREPLTAGHHFQELITPPREADIVVVILWARLGVMLPPEKFPGPLSGKPVTGTEWEFEDALASYRARKVPDLLMYRKQSKIMVALDDHDVLTERQQQRRLAEDFIRRWFMEGAGRTFTAAFREFSTETEFEELLETHLRELLRKRVDRFGVGGGIEVRWHRGSPYRGLQSFELEHAPVFFGRRRARNELRNLLQRQAARGCAFALVLGASGSGKSSLVKAGLLADLQLPGMVERVALVRHATSRPADRPGDLVAGLAAAVFAALPELRQLQYDEATLSGLFRSSSSQVELPIRQALSAASREARLMEHAEARLIVVIDQLEELFSAASIQTDERDAFLSLFSHLAASGLVWVVATMRSDFFGHVIHAPRLAELATADACYLLAPPNEGELGDIVRQPAREAGLTFQRDDQTGLSVDEAVRQEAAKDPGALPILEFLLDELWKLRSASGVLTWQAYRQLGGLRGALGRRAEQEFARLDAEVQDALPRVLRRLVAVGRTEGAPATARSASLSDFPAGTADRQLLDAFLAPDARLFVADGDRDSARVRIAHEALLSHWDRARRQVASDRADIQLRGRLEEAVAHWHDRGRAPSLLLPEGLPLAEAQDLLRRQRAELPAPLVEYVEASAAAARRASRRRRRIRVGGIAATLAIFWLGSIAAAMAILVPQIAERSAALVLAADLRTQGLAQRLASSPSMSNEEKGETLALAEELFATVKSLAWDSPEARHVEARNLLAFERAYAAAHMRSAQVERARRAVEKLALLESQEPGDPFWVSELAGGQLRLGEALAAAGDIAGALAAFREGAVLRERLAIADPGAPDVWRDWSNAWLAFCEIALANRPSVDVESCMTAERRWATLVDRWPAAQELSDGLAQLRTILAAASP